jgi:hypothetical protein
MQAYQDLLARSESVSQTPFQAYSGQEVAPINAQQTTGVGSINTGASGFTPYTGQAGADIAGGTQAVTGNDINQYMDPYTNQVINATQNDFNTQNQRANSIVTGNAAAQGALGGNRVGVAQALTQEGETRAQDPIIAGLRSQGFQSAEQMANAQKAREIQGGQTLAQTGLQEAGAQVGAGTMEQQTSQAQNTQAMTDYYTQQGYPFATAQWLASQILPTGSQMGSTSTGTSATQGPTPNSWLQGAGLGIAGLGALGQAGGSAGIAGLAPMLAALKTGGAANAKTVPENSNTLKIQQQQLINGHRHVQMFPNGTKELPLPSGMQRTKTHKGIFHHNPSVVSSRGIHSAVSSGQENEILNLGPVSKDEAIHRAYGGDIPISIVERSPDGTEVRAAGGTIGTAHQQAHYFNQTKSPGNLIHIEHPSETINRRASGGAIHGFAAGGNPYGAGVTGPWGTSRGYTPPHGWVPTGGAVRGTPLRDPGFPQQPRLPDQSISSSSISGIGKNIGSIGNSLYNWSNTPSSPPSGGETDAGSLDSWNAGYNNGNKRGGRISGFDMGGGVPVSSGFGGGAYGPGGSVPDIDMSDEPPISYTPSTPDERASDYNALRLSGRDVNPEAGNGIIASNAGLNASPDIGVASAEPATGSPIVDKAITAFKGVTSGRGFKPSVDVPSSASALDETGAPATEELSAAPRRGVAAGAAPSGGMGGFNPLNLSDQARQGLISMGLGMMANRRGGPGSFLAGVGEAGEQGMTTYANAMALTHQQELERQKLQQAWLLHNAITPYQRAQLERETVAPVPGSMTSDGHQIGYDKRTGKTFDMITNQPLTADQQNGVLTGGWKPYPSKVTEEGDPVLINPQGRMKNAATQEMLPPGIKLKDAKQGLGDMFAPPTSDDKSSVPDKSIPKAAKPIQYNPENDVDPTKPLSAEQQGKIEDYHADKMTDTLKSLENTHAPGTHPEVLDALVANMGSRGKGIAATIKAVSEGRQTLASVPGRNVDFNGQKINLKDIVESGVNTYNPGWEQSNATTRANTMKDLAPNGTTGKLILGVNQLLPHLKTASDAVDALDNRNYPVANKITNWTRSNIGDPRVSRFNTVRDVVALDAARILRGGGVFTEKEVQDWHNNLSNAGSPAALNGVLNLLGKDLMGARVNSIQHSYRMLAGKEAPLLISPEAQSALKVIEERDLKSNYPTPKAASGAPPATDANIAVGTERQFKQGTGVWNGTKWVPKGTQ